MVGHQVGAVEAEQVEDDEGGPHPVDPEPGLFGVGEPDTKSVEGRFAIVAHADDLAVQQHLAAVEGVSSRGQFGKVSAWALPGRLVTATRWPSTVISARMPSFFRWSKCVVAKCVGCLSRRQQNAGTREPLCYGALDPRDFAGYRVVGDTTGGVVRGAKWPETTTTEFRTRLHDRHHVGSPIEHGTLDKVCGRDRKALFGVLPSRRSGTLGRRRSGRTFRDTRP
jgi:hypothetical protein